MRAVSCGGSSLVEALVAMVVVAIGLGGVASLMIASLRNGHEALLRTQAVNLVSDMQERIRANPAAGAAYDCGAYPGGPSIRSCAASEVAAGVNCTARELAEDDLARWQGAVRVALPSCGASAGAGAAAGAAACDANVTYTAAPSSAEPARYLVSVSWPQRGVSSPVTYQSDLLLVLPKPSP